MHRLPGAVNYGNFPQANKNGSIFFTKPEFDFLASDISYVSLVNEACASLQIPHDMLDQQVELFKNSVNRDPDVFRVPDDGGDPFFKKLNLGLSLKNLRQTDPIHTRAEAVIDFMQTGFNSLTTTTRAHADTVAVLTAFKKSPFGYNSLNTKTAQEVKQILQTLTADQLHNAILKLIQYFNVNQYRPIAKTLGSDVDLLMVTFSVVGKTRWGNFGSGNVNQIVNSIWKGRENYVLDELKVFVYNMYPAFKNQITFGRINQARPEDKYFNASGVISPNPTDIFLNLGERLRRDAFYREQNFKEVLQEVGVSVEEFERLVENAVSVVYWPDCIASKVSDQDLYNLVKGFGLPVDSLQDKSKSEICSFILTSLGFRPQHFSGNPGPLDLMLGTESVQLLQRIVRAIRDPKLDPPTAGYLGFNAADLGNPDRAIAAGTQLHGAYLMTGFAAHNVTAEKAARWLQATGVDASTQAGFLSYVGNENTFDIMDKRKDMRKINFTGNMDYTKQMLDKKLVHNGKVGLWYS